MKVNYLRYQKCAACKVSLRHKNYSRYIRVMEFTVGKTRIFFIYDNIQVGVYICFKCRNNLNKNKNIKNGNNEDSILHFSSEEDESISNKSITSFGKQIELF